MSKRLQIRPIFHTGKYYYIVGRKRAQDNAWRGRFWQIRPAGDGWRSRAADLYEMLEGAYATVIAPRLSQYIDRNFKIGWDQ